jgi:UDP-N-acetylglucosamine 4-epimerase
MTAFEKLKAELLASPRTWLVTGAAGFIGSNISQTLLELGQTVRGLDNFSTGHRKNIEEIQASLSPEKWAKFTLVEGDIRDLATCQRACLGVDYVLHQAALCSVPGSMEDPLKYCDVNITGTLHMLLAARDQRVKRFVYASSCAVYGDNPALPKEETQPACPLSPYGLSKQADELCAQVFARAYGLETIGLRYFNVFGPRQDPAGAYAAVIPKWITALIKNEPVFINGDGETSRDFCYVANVVQANLLAATCPNPDAVNQVYNVALGQRTTLNELFHLLRDALAADWPPVQKREPIYRDFRPGDAQYAWADISLAKQLLGYEPARNMAQAFRAAIDFYARQGNSSPG